MSVHYRIAMISPERPWGNGAVWDAYQELKVAGHCVDLIDASAVPGLLGPDGQPDEGLLGAYRRAFAPDYVAWQGESAAEVLAALEGSGKGGAERARRFVVFGYIGAANFGDDLLLDTVANRLRAAYPGAVVDCLGHDARRLLARSGAASASMLDLHAMQALLNGADALVFIGGLLVDLNYEGSAGLLEPFQGRSESVANQAVAVQLAHMLGVPSVFFCIGAGPLANREVQRIVELESLARPRYIVRDAHSGRLLLDAGVDPGLVSIAADAAFLLEAPEAGAGEGAGRPLPDGRELPGRYAAAILRDSPTIPAGFDSACARALDRFCAERGLQPVFLAFQPADGECHGRIAALMESGVQPVFLDAGDIGSDAVLDVIAGARAVLATRFHGSVLANLSGVPCAGVNYNDKVEAYYRQMGAEDFLIAPDAGADAIHAALSGACEQGPEGASALAARVEESRKAALAAFAELRAVVEAHEARPVMQFGYPQLTADQVALGDARREMAALVERAERAESRVRELESSTTWRAGRALTAIPRAIAGRKGR